MTLPMRLYKASKILLRFKNKAADFINAYTTNTPEAEKNAFVDIRGKIVAVFDQKYVSPDEVLVIIEAKFRERLLGHLDKYLKLSDTVIEEDKRFVYFDLDAPAPHLFLSEKELPAGVSAQEFEAFRAKNKIRIQGTDYDNELLPNVFPEGYVSYTKGCYLGQEIIARVHYRGKGPKPGQ